MRDFSRHFEVATQGFHTLPVSARKNTAETLPIYKNLLFFFLS